MFAFDRLHGMTQVLSLLYSFLLCTVMSAAHSGNALVLYDESTILPHHKPHKSFNFGGSKVTIRQSWTQDGVAGVVWDAVRLRKLSYEANAKSKLYHGHSDKKLFQFFGEEQKSWH